MAEARVDFIKKYYTDIQLHKDYLEIYSVRKAIFESLKSNLPKFKGLVLDVGCGIMPYREFILQNKEVSKYVGLDFESSLHREYAMAQPDLFWDGNTIDLADNSVDTVLATELLEHCPDAGKVIAEMYRVLKPGGMLFLTVPFIWNLHLVPHDEYRYTSFSLKRLLCSNGFTDVNLKALGGWDASLAQMLGIWYKYRPSRLKRRFSFLFIRAIKILLRKDAFFNKENIYSEGIMVTGFSGTAIKNPAF